MSYLYTAVESPKEMIDADAEPQPEVEVTWLGRDDGSPFHMRILYTKLSGCPSSNS